MYFTGAVSNLPMKIYQMSKQYVLIQAWFLNISEI